MSLKIETPGFVPDAKLLSFVEEHIAALDKFSDKILSVVVYLQLPTLSQRIKDKITKIELTLPGKTLVVQKKAKKFESSLTFACKSLKILLNETVKKQQRQYRQQAA